jgi:hypothetical protein
MPVHGTSSEHSIPSGNIRSGHLVEDTPSIIYAPKLEYISMRLVQYVYGFICPLHVLID